MGFQENLKKYRELAGYHQAKDYAKVLGISYPTYMGYENRGREPKFDLLIKIASTLHVSIDELLGYDPKYPDKLQKCLTDLKDKGIEFEIIKGDINYLQKYAADLVPPDLLKQKPIPLYGFMIPGEGENLRYVAASTLYELKSKADVEFEERVKPIYRDIFYKILYLHFYKAKSKDVNGR